MVTEVSGGNRRADGEKNFNRACMSGVEGIVAKPKYLGYERGRSRRWFKNPNSPAPRRAEDGSFWMWMPTQPFIAASVSG